ncbi:MAG: DUF4261 domain-containing protein [Kofleriaceae bacterium]
MSEAEIAPGRQLLLCRVLYARPIAIDQTALADALAERLPGSEATAPDANGAITIRTPGVIEVAEGNVPASYVITAGAIEPYPAEAFAQTWSADKATIVDAAKKGRFAITVSELTSMMLPTDERIPTILQVVASVVDSHPPLALHWTRHERFDLPDAFIESVDEIEEPERLLVNVRLFRVGEREYVMDTLGLCLLGLLDLQIHFRDLDVYTVAECLYITAMTQMLRDEPLDDGGKISGPDDADATCRYEMSLIAPRRGVVDLEPGATHSAR